MAICYFKIHDNKYKKYFTDIKKDFINHMKYEKNNLDKKILISIATIELAYILGMELDSEHKGEIEKIKTEINEKFNINKKFKINFHRK